MTYQTREPFLWMLGNWNKEFNFRLKSEMITWEKKIEIKIKKGTKVSESHAATAAKSLQSCPTLCDPIDGSPPGSPVPGILQAGILEWVVISFSNARKWKVKVKSLSRVRLFATPWTAAYQAPPSMWDTYCLAISVSISPRKSVSRQVMLRRTKRKSWQEESFQGKVLGGQSWNSLKEYK